jgi:hypothetical protein
MSRRTCLPFDTGNFGHETVLKHRRQRHQGHSLGFARWARPAREIEPVAIDALDPIRMPRFYEFQCKQAEHPSAEVAVDAGVGGTPE